MEKGVQRWVVDISKWNPSPNYFASVLSFLPHHEQSSIIRYVRMEDRKRALVSRLLQYALTHELLGILSDEIIIKRTLEGKPYLECDKVGIEFPNFNFNVSHHGDFVAIASEPLCLVGLDIVCCVTPCKETVQEFIQNFSSYFSSLEWDNMLSAGTCEEILVKFYKYWCLKEAYVKAIGSGLAYGLDKVEFHHDNWTNIFMKVDDVAVTEWRFWIFELGKRHWVSVARGPPGSATESYKRTINRVEFDEEEYNQGLHLANVSFVWKTVDQLVKVAYGGNGMRDEQNNTQGL